jgi:hypothetical protein
MSLDPDTISGNTYVAAFAGAVLGLKAIPGDSRGTRAANLLFGFLIAVYGGPAAVDYLHVTSVKIASGLVFAIGASGLVIFAAVIDGVRQTPLGAILTSWLSRGAVKERKETEL